MRSRTLFVNDLLLRLLGREYWARGTIGLTQWGISYLLMLLNTGMSVMVSENVEDTALHKFLFPSYQLRLQVSHSPLYSVQPEVQKYRSGAATHRSCVTGAAGLQPVVRTHRFERDCHTISQSLPRALCQLPHQCHHIQGYYIFSPSPVFPLKVTFKNISVLSWNTLRKASVHVILSDQRQRKSGFSTIHQIPFGRENFNVVLCQATMPAFSKMSEDNLNRNLNRNSEYY